MPPKRIFVDSVCRLPDHRSNAVEQDPFSRSYISPLFENLLLRSQLNRPRETSLQVQADFHSKGYCKSHDGLDFPV